MSKTLIESVLAGTTLVVVVAFVSPAFAAAPVSAPAQDAPTKDEARARFSRGVELFREENFSAALIEFNRAYEAIPNFTVLYNIGQTCIELQDHASALRALEKYLAEGNDQIPPARRGEVEADIERLRARVGYLRIQARLENADVAIDDVVIGRGPMDAEFVVNAGRRKVTVHAAQREPTTRMIDVAVSERARIEFDVPPTPTRPRPVESASSSAPLWIGLASTGVFAAGTVVSGLFTLSAKDSLDREVHTYPTTPRAVADARDSATTLVTVTDVLGASTLVAAGVTAILFLTRKTPAKSSTSSVTGGLGIFGRF